jgi:hypothetical protein
MGIQRTDTEGKNNPISKSEGVRLVYCVCPPVLVRYSTDYHHPGSNLRILGT